jgi:hypothetical protein
MIMKFIEKTDNKTLIMNNKLCTHNKLNLSYFLVLFIAFSIKMILSTKTIELNKVINRNFKKNA